jgi:hypothetical protein
MPWLAVDYKETARIASLKQRYGINGLPTLVILDQDGQDSKLMMMADKISSTIILTP